MNPWVWVARGGLGWQNIAETAESSGPPIDSVSLAHLREMHRRLGELLGRVGGAPQQPSEAPPNDAPRGNRRWRHKQS